MKFRIERIFRNDTYNKRPLAVEFTLPPDRPAEDITDPVDKLYCFDLAGKHLQTFESFRAIVADEFGVWLSSPAAEATPFDRRAGKEWSDMVSQAFHAGRQLQTAEPEVQDGGGWSDFEGREIDRAFAGEPEAEPESEQLMRFLKNDLSARVVDHTAQLLANDSELSVDVIKVLRQRMELIFSLAMKIRTRTKETACPVRQKITKGNRLHATP